MVGNLSYIRTKGTGGTKNTQPRRLEYYSVTNVQCEICLRFARISTNIGIMMYWDILYYCLERYVNEEG